jgi:hypothetical protein
MLVEKIKKLLSVNKHVIIDGFKLKGEFTAVYEGKDSWACRKGKTHTLTISNGGGGIQIFVHTTYYASGEPRFYKSEHDFKKDWKQLKKVKNGGKI